MSAAEADPAAESVILAQQEFAATAGEHGSAAALAVFNSRVSAWANSFSAKKHQKFAYVLGSVMDGQSHSFRISQQALIRRYEKLYGQKRDRRTLTRLTAELSEAGTEIIEVTRQRQDERGECPGMQRSSVYQVRFDRVLQDGHVVPHDFLRGRGADENVPQVVPQNVPQNVPPTITPTLQNPLPGTLSSSRPDDDLPRDSRDSAAGRAARDSGHEMAGDESPAELLRQDLNAWLVEVYGQRATLLDSPAAGRLADAARHVPDSADPYGCVFDAVTRWLLDNYTARSPRSTAAVVMACLPQIVAGYSPVPAAADDATGPDARARVRSAEPRPVPVPFTMVSAGSVPQIRRGTGTGRSYETSRLASPHLARKLGERLGALGKYTAVPPDVLDLLRQARTRGEWTDPAAQDEEAACAPRQ
jgi:hypothetical protein